MTFGRPVGDIVSENNRILDELTIKSICIILDVIHSGFRSLYVIDRANLKNNFKKNENLRT